MTHANLGVAYIWTEDVTDDPDFVAIANRMCADAYSQRYRGDQDAEAVYSGFSDEQACRYRRTFVAFGRQLGRDENHILGTASLRLGADCIGETNAFEFMETMDAQGGWENFEYEGFCIAKGMETTRFAFADVCSGTTESHQATRIEVINRLWDAHRAAGAAFGCDQQWGILPLAAAIFLSKDCHIQLRKVPGVVPRAWSEHHALCPRYWREARPSLYLSLPRTHSDPTAMDRSEKNRGHGTKGGTLPTKLLRSPG